MLSRSTPYTYTSTYTSNVHVNQITPTYAAPPANWPVLACCTHAPCNVTASFQRGLDKERMDWMDRLAQKEVLEFVRRATAIGLHTPDLSTYTWHEGPHGREAAVKVYDTDHSVITIPFSDFVATQDGLFFYGWNAT